MSTPAPAQKKPNPVKLCYFVGNANGRGLVRIEIDGSEENAGFHIASMTRGKESWAAEMVDRWNCHGDMIAALIKAESCLAYAVMALEAPIKSSIREDLETIRATIAAAKGE